MTRTSLIVICWSLWSTVIPPEAVAASVDVAPAVSGSPLPLTSPAPANAKLARPVELSAKAPHLISAGRKSLPTYGYMKQASDDRDGLSRLQDQARQLRPPR